MSDLQYFVLYFISFILTVNWRIVLANLDRGTLYFPAGKAFDLRCQNKTEGNFATVFWYGTPYANRTVTITTDIYRYDNTQKTFVSPYFENRIQRIHGTSLRILQSRITDSGNYKCDIVYELNGDLKVATLASYTVHIVSPPDHLDLTTRLLVLAVGQTHEVFCESQANSPFNITWYKDGGKFTDHVKVDRTVEKIHGQRPYITYIKRTYLHFKNLTEKDVGKYICIASNLGGNVTKPMDVRIKRAPVIISRDSFEIDVQVSGSMECKAKGYPQMDFTWQIYPFTDKSFTISQGESLDDFTVTRTIYNSDTEIGTSSLMISKVMKSYHGKYKCIASTPDSKAEKVITLSGKAPPDPPSILYDDAEVKEHSIELFWQLGDDGGAPITSVLIEHKNSSDIKGWFSVDINSPITDYNIQNLEKSTSYDFRILARNDQGESEYSQIATFATKGADVITVQPAMKEDSDQILGSLDMTAMIGIFGGAFIALVIGFICVCIFVRKMQKGDKDETVPPQHSMASYAPNNSTAATPLTMVDGHAAALEMEPLTNMRQADEWEFPRDRLTITTVLGAGAFGVVMRGLAQGIKGSVGQVTVAVKTVRDSTNEAATKDLVAELNLLKLIPEHQNVVGLLGCCSYADPLYVIVEYCSNGDLQGFLRSSRGIYERYYRTSYGGAVPDLTCKMLLTFAWQITKGMNHLSSMKVIHRDLAARNVLVDDQLVCKVSDFGFARDIYIEDHYLKRSAGGRFPIKWMAIESLLDGISTTRSDVWSFGVVLWELVTLGASPYPGMNSYEVVSFLQDGYRMDKPKHCSDEVYQLMMDCWCVAPGRRPSFMDLINRCQLLMEECETKELIDMNFYPDHLYVNFDGSSSAMSSATTPHGTLNRHLVNNVKMSNDQLHMNGQLTNPRSKLRSASQNSMPTGRTSSVAALSERSVTGQSSTSYHGSVHPSERVGLLASSTHS